MCVTARQQNSSYPDVPTFLFVCLISLRIVSNQSGHCFPRQTLILCGAFKCSQSIVFFLKFVNLSIMVLNGYQYTVQPSPSHLFLGCNLSKKDTSWFHEKKKKFNCAAG